MVLLGNFPFTNNLYDGDAHDPQFLSESKSGKLVNQASKVYTFQLEHVLVLESVLFTLKCVRGEFFFFKVVVKLNVLLA